MKKILALALFLGFSVSAFAVPTCTQFDMQGMEIPLYDAISGQEVINNPRINPIEFTCTINGIAPGEESHYVLFAYEDNPITTKSNNLLAKDLFQVGEEFGNFIVPFAKNTEKTQDYEHKVWVPESGPVLVTEEDNGTTLTNIWADAIGNQPGFEGVAGYWPHVFMGICSNPEDMETCNVIMDRKWSPIGAFGTYYGYPVVEDGLFTTSYAATDNANVEIYIIDGSPVLTLEEWYSPDLHNLLGEHLVTWENLGIVEPSTNGEVHYYTFPDTFSLEPGYYDYLIRYTRKPNIMSNKGRDLAQIQPGQFYYDPVGIVDELEIKKLVNSANKISFECDGSGICNIYDVAGRVINTIPFTEQFEHNKTEKNGVYLYNVKSEGKQTTIKSIGK